MSPNRRTCALASLVVSVALSALADTPPLGEVAKNEQDRREKLKKAGTAGRTFTEEDLANTKGRLANEPDAGTATSAAGEAKRGGAPAPRRGKRASTEPASSEGQEQYWRDRVAEARGRVEEAQRRSLALERMIRFGQPAQYDANGQRFIYSISQMKEIADGAAAELASAQAALENLLEEGRHAGALPGWLR